MKRGWGPRLGVIAPPLLAWGIGGALTVAFTSQVTSWYVMTDELQHVKLAISVWDNVSLWPRLHGRNVEIYSQLYPVLTAPVYGLLPMQVAFDVVHVFNAIAMASAAVPIYLLARGLALPTAAAVVVATVSVVTPWMTFAVMMMTEVVAYPAFCWAILAIQRAVAEPSPHRDLLALVAVAVAFFARTQLFVVGALYLTVVMLHALVYPLVGAQAGDRAVLLRTAPKDLVRGHPFLAAAVLAAAAVPLTGSSYGELLGTYGGATGGDLLPAGLLDFAVEHLDFIAVGVGVIPFVVAIGWALAATYRPVSKEHHVFALVLLVAVPLLSLQVSSFLLRFGTGGVHERYLFYLAPLFFLGLAVFFYGGIRRSQLAGTAAAGAAFFLIANNAAYNSTDAVFFSSPAAVFHRVLGGQADRLGAVFGIEGLSPTPLIQVVALAAGVGLPLALRHLPRRPVIVVVALGVCAFSAIQYVYVFARAVDDEGFKTRDWIDQRLSDDAQVGLVPFPVGGFPPAIWWNAEFWNKTVTRSYTYRGEYSYTPFPKGSIELNRRTGGLTSPEPALARYLVMHEEDRRFRPAGRAVAEEAGLQLLELGQPATAAWAADGFGHAATFPEGAEIRVYGGPGRGRVRRRVTFLIAASQEIDAALPRGPQERRRYELQGPGLRRAGTLRPGEQEAVRVHVCVPRRSSTTIKITGTGAGYHGAAPGTRGLPIGLKVPSIEVDRASGPCDRRR